MAKIIEFNKEYRKEPDDGYDITAEDLLGMEEDYQYMMEHLDEMFDEATASDIREIDQMSTELIGRMIKNKMGIEQDETEFEKKQRERAERKIEKMFEN